MSLIKNFTLATFICSAHSAFATTYQVAPQPLPNVPATLQFRTISDAAQKVAPGDVVQLHSGTYRETVNIKTSGTREKPIRFEAAPAANVTVSGADILDKWEKVADTGADNVFVTDWDHRFINWSKNMTHPDDDYHLLIGRGEQVTVNNYALRQVLSRDKLTRGTFFSDVENKKLYLQTSDNSDQLAKDDGWKPRVEAAVREVSWNCGGDWVQLRGVTFSMCANSAQNGMAKFSGRFNSISDCNFLNSNGSGANFLAPDITVRRCTFADNGQLGWSAKGAHRMLMSDCLTTRNNLKNFSRGWEAGGDKIVLSREMIIEKSRFIANRGIGIWFDIGNENNTVRNCLIADNEDAGIFYEISYGLHAHDNVIINNGFTADPYAWGANGGIALSSSPGCEIERNLILGNKEGFQFREAKRTTPRINDTMSTDDVINKAPNEEAVWNHDQKIHNNVFAWNRDAGVWGWFDVNDQRMWPRALWEKNTADKAAPGDMAADYVAKGQVKTPQNMALPDLNFQFSNNLYTPGDNGGVFNWGTGWKRNRKYLQIAEVNKELNLEQNSVVAPFAVKDYLTRDLRVPADSLALKMKCYPQGEVPGVMLGVLK